MAIFVSTHFHTFCFHKTAELSSHNTDYMAHKSELLTIWPFTENVCQLLL